MKISTTYRYLAGRSILELDETLNKVDNNYLLTQLQKTYDKIKENNVQYDGKYASDVRSREERQLNYFVGQALEKLTIHTMIKNPKFHGFIMNWEGFINLIHQIVYNSDTNKKLVKIIGKNKIKIMEELLTDFNDELVNSGGLPLSFQQNDKLINLYLSTMKIKREIMKLNLTYPPEEPPKVPDLLLLLKKKLILDDKHQTTVNYAIPIEVLYTTNSHYSFRYDKKGNSKFDLFKNTHYLLYKIEPPLNYFAKNKIFRRNDESQTYPIFKNMLNLYYYIIQSETIKRKIKRKAYNIGTKMFDTYTHNTVYLKFHKNDRELIAKELTTFIKKRFDKKIKTHFEERGYNKIKIIM